MPVASALSRVWRALASRWRAALHDLFGEEHDGSPASSAWAVEAQALLDQAETQAAGLREARLGALARALQVDRDWQAAGRAVQRQDAAVDEALLVGREAVARARQHELNLWRRRQESLGGRRSAEHELVEQLTQAAQSPELQIAAARRALDSLHAHDPADRGQAQLTALRQTLARLAALANGKDGDL